VIAVFPFHKDTADPLADGEHRIAEQIAIALHRADKGAFERWPDTRRVIDRPRRDLVEAVHREQTAHRLGPHDRLLHVAASDVSWVATPIAVFSGAIETSVSTRPDRSPHSYGGRLLPLSELPELLGEHRYRYVLLEPRGLKGASEIRQGIVGSGYRAIYHNEEGELFRLSWRSA